MSDEEEVVFEKDKLKFQELRSDFRSETDRSVFENEQSVEGQKIVIARDSDGVISKNSIIQFFDNRKRIKGLKNLILEFKEKRRKLLASEHKELYDKTVTNYCKTIDSKMEVNLIYLAKKLNISR